MNCGQTISFSFSSNEFLHTTYSPMQGGKQFVNKSNRPAAAEVSRRWRESYSQRKTFGSVGGEHLFFPGGLGPTVSRVPRHYWRVRILVSCKGTEGAPTFHSVRGSTAAGCPEERAPILGCRPTTVSKLDSAMRLPGVAPARPRCEGMSVVNGAPWNTQDAVAERTEAVSL